MDIRTVKNSLYSTLPFLLGRFMFLEFVLILTAVIFIEKIKQKYRVNDFVLHLLRSNSSY